MPSADDTDLIRRFEEFYRDDYRDEIEAFVKRYPEDQQVLYIDWDDLNRYDPDLAREVITAPERVLECAEEALRRHGSTSDDELRDARVFVNQIGESTSPTAFRSRHLGNLVEISGRVAEVSSVTSVLSEGAWECERCGAVTHVSCIPRPGRETSPHECPGCDQQGPFSLDHDESEWTDHHSFVVEHNSPDSPPETIVVEVFSDATEAIAAGQYVRVTGILRREALGDHNESSVPDKYIQAYAGKVGERAGIDRSSDDERRILELSNDPDLFERLVDSVAPSILGYREEKLAILLQLFAGVPKELPDGSQMGGGIHTLLVGDPGTAKSDLGDAAQRLSPNGRRLGGTRGNMSTARNADAVDSSGPRMDASWSSGVGKSDGPAPEFLFVDIGERSDEAREELIHILESRGVPENGSNTSPDAETSVLGVATPRYGRFDAYEPIGTQLNLEPSLLSQFDLIFTSTDKPDEATDRELANHLLELYYAGELRTHHSNVNISPVSQDEVDRAVDTVAPPIEPDVLCSYIAFARRYCYPTMTEEAKAAIRKFYVSLRKEGRGDDAPVPVTARKLEALVKLAEASARVRLADNVTTEDAERAIGLVRSSLLDVGIDPETGEFDADIVEAGLSKTQRDHARNLKGIIRELQDDYEAGATFDAIFEWTEQVGIDRSKAEDAIQRLKERDEVYEPSDGHFRVV